MNCIFYTSNFNDIGFLYNSLYTLRKHFNGDVYILTDSDNTPSSLDQFNVICINCKELFYSVFTNKKIHELKNSAYTIVSFFRMLIPFIDVLLQYDNALYLDTDTIILNNIDDIFKIECKNFPYTMFVTNHGNKIYNYNVLTQYKRLCDANIDRIFKPTSYDNSGVILFNTKLLDLNKIFYQNRMKYLNKIFNKEFFKYPDQCALNLFFEHNQYNDKHHTINTNTITDQQTKIVHYYVKHKKKQILDLKIQFYRVFGYRCDWKT